MAGVQQRYRHRQAGRVGLALCVARAGGSTAAQRNLAHSTAQQRTAANAQHSLAHHVADVVDGAEAVGCHRHCLHKKLMIPLAPPLGCIASRRSGRGCRAAAALAACHVCGRMEGHEQGRR
jgi:hypothetical protein